MVGKSASGTGGLPTDHLHKHGTSAASNILCPSFYGAVTEYLRGRIITYGEARSIYGGDLQFTGSCEILRGVLKCV